MGFFPNIFKKPQNILKSTAKVVSSVVKDPGRTLTAIATSGLSEAARTIKPLAPLVNTASQLYGTGARAVLGAYTGGLSEVALGGAQYLTAPKPSYQGVEPMALNIGGILGQVGTIFGGAKNPYFQGVSGVANLASQFFPQPGSSLPAVRSSVGTPVMSAAPMIARGVATVGRGFFNRFPNLAVAIQGLRNQGKNVSRAKLYSLMKRFGPDFLITGGILTAAAVSELMVAGPGHRRMNPGNASALRRSLRRLESFHKLCARADKFRGGAGRRRKGCKTVGA